MRHEKQTIAVYPTRDVADQLADDFPDLPAVVRAFSVDDGLRLTDGERESGRTAFGISPAEAVVCLVGGWWPYKDIRVIDAALNRLKEPLHLVVAGYPLDESVLARWRNLPCSDCTPFRAPSWSACCGWSTALPMPPWSPGTPVSGRNPAWSWMPPALVFR